VYLTLRKRVSKLAEEHEQKRKKFLRMAVLFMALSISLSLLAYIAFNRLVVALGVFAFTQLSINFWINRRLKSTYKRIKGRLKELERKARFSA
jgi:uncharacterized membrane protein YadS